MSHEAIEFSDKDGFFKGNRTCLEKIFVFASDTNSTNIHECRGKFACGLRPQLPVEIQKGKAYGFAFLYSSGKELDRFFANLLDKSFISRYLRVSRAKSPGL